MASLFWKILYYFSLGFVVITWVILILSAVDFFDRTILHHKDAYWLPILILTAASVFALHQADKRINN